MFLRTHMENEPSNLVTGTQAKFRKGLRSALREERLGELEGGKERPSTEVLSSVHKRARVLGLGLLLLQLCVLGQSPNSGHSLISPSHPPGLLRKSNVIMTLRWVSSASASSLQGRSLCLV